MAEDTPNTAVATAVDIFANRACEASAHIGCLLNPAAVVLVVQKDRVRERDFLRYADFEIDRLPWWKRWLRRFERVGEMHR